MGSNKTYHVEYIFTEFGKVHGIDVLAKNKWDAYDKAVYEAIPKRDGGHPYAAWVASVTYQNGNHKAFNTFAGKPV